jgi:tRNA(fMet)-specific endonuclease VapC
MYCLDTSIIIDFMRGDHLTVDKINALDSKGEPFCITSITLAELYKGAYLSSRAEKGLSEIDVLLSLAEIITLNREACQSYGKSFSHLQMKGRHTEELDLFIAAIVQAHRAILVTRNKKHFEHTGIKVEEW